MNRGCDKAPVEWRLYFSGLAHGQMRHCRELMMVPQESNEIDLGATPHTKARQGVAAGLERSDEPSNKLRRLNSCMLLRIYSHELDRLPLAAQAEVNVLDKMVEFEGFLNSQPESHG